MTPKEKAKELFDKYIIIYNKSNWNFFCLAQDASFLAVDEIIILCKFYNATKEQINYWQEVKKHISMF